MLKPTHRQFVLDPVWFILHASRMDAEAVAALSWMMALQWTEGPLKAGRPCGNPALTQALAVGFSDSVGGQFRHLLTEHHDGSWTVAMLDEQRASLDAFVERQRKNGRKGGRPRKQLKTSRKNPSLSGGFSEGSEPKPIPPLSGGFSEGHGNFLDEPESPANTGNDDRNPSVSGGFSVDNHTYNNRAGSDKGRGEGGREGMQGEGQEEEGKGKEKEGVEDRKRKFIAACQSTNDEKKILPPEEFKKFIDLWTEVNPGGRKMRWEIVRSKQGTFSPSRRMATWRSNMEKYGGTGKKSGPVQPSTPDQIDDKW